MVTLHKLQGNNFDLILLLASIYMQYNETNHPIRRLPPDAPDFPTERKPLVDFEMKGWKAMLQGVL